MTAVLKPTGSPSERFTSPDVADFPHPTGREEEWRFTPLRLIRDVFDPFESDSRITRGGSVPAPAKAEVIGRDHPAFGRVLKPADRVSALAFANTPGALLITVPAEAELDEPVVITATAEPGRMYGHVVIDVGAYAKATVIIEHRGSATVLSNVEILAGDGSQVTVVSVQEWDAGAVHLISHAMRVGRDASLKHVVVNLGGSLVRVAPTVQYAGPGGSVELLGVSFAGDGQHLETRLYVDHSVPNCRSHVLYKNALQGEKARTVWIGDVRIRPEAIGTETFELNRNLILTDGARADSVPNLEIETGEIAGAGHASATGRFDDLHLFYLQSRGIPEDEARRLVVRGFFADVLGRIGIPDLAERLMAAIESRLELNA